MMSPRSSRTSGFSLVEMLTVIAIIGILAVILIPTVSGVQERAQRTAAASKLRNIHTAYTAYSTEGSRVRTINADDIYDWARRLAQYADFNDPDAYLVDQDLYVQGEESRPAVIATAPPNGTGDWTVHPDFNGYPLSFAVANRLSTQAPASTPLAWTRGLDQAGTWSSDDAVYEGDGGHILRIDGSVEFYEDLGADGGQLLDYRTQAPTANMNNALSPNAVGLESSGPVF